MCLIAVLWIVPAGADTWRYYRQRGWITSWGVPLRKAPEPIVEYLRSQQSFAYFFGAYWDVYRLTFLTGEHVKGMPVQELRPGEPGLSRALNRGATKTPFLSQFGVAPVYDHLRLRGYQREARRQQRIGVVFNLHRRFVWRAPEAAQLLFKNEQYAVYVLPMKEGGVQQAKRVGCPDQRVGSS